MNINVDVNVAVDGRTIVNPDPSRSSGRSLDQRPTVRTPSGLHIPEDQPSAAVPTTWRAFRFEAPKGWSRINVRTYGVAGEPVQMYFSAEYFWGSYWCYERHFQTKWEVNGWIWDDDERNRVLIHRFFRIDSYKIEKFLVLNEAENLRPWLQCDLRVIKTFGHWQAHPGCCTVEAHIKGAF